MLYLDQENQFFGLEERRRVNINQNGFQVPQNLHYVYPENYTDKFCLTQDLNT